MLDGATSVIAPGRISSARLLPLGVRSGRSSIDVILASGAAAGKLPGTTNSFGCDSLDRDALRLGVLLAAGIIGVVAGGGVAVIEVVDTAVGGD